MLAPTSPGDVLDRLTILDLKVARIPDPARVAVAADHRDALRAAWAQAGLPSWSELPEHDALASVNAELWDVEDALRACEAAADFGERFVALARSVYRLNDRRAALKGSVDRRFQARHTDVKGYAT